MSNTFLRQGITFSDDQIRSHFNIDPSIKDIDRAAFDSIEINNVIAYIQEGMSEEQAKMKARQMRSAAMNNATRNENKFKILQ